jgi:hypothetical protein
MSKVVGTGGTASFATSGAVIGKVIDRALKHTNSLSSIHKLVSVRLQQTFQQAPSSVIVGKFIGRALHETSSVEIVRKQIKLFSACINTLARADISVV